MSDWIIGLAFETPEGAFCVEPWRYRVTLGPALALARRDAAAAAFGRVFRGFASVDRTNPQLADDALPRVSRAEKDPTVPLEQLLLPHHHVDDGATAAEPPRHPVPLEGLTAVRWWELEGAFGGATAVGVALGRCASTSAPIAAEAAARLGERIARNQHLFPVTAAALPFLVELIAAREVSCRVLLAGWLEVIARSAHAANDVMSNLLASAAKLVARDVAEDFATHQRAAREVAAELKRLAPRLRGLQDDEAVGPHLRAALPSL